MSKLKEIYLLMWVEAVKYRLTLESVALNSIMQQALNRLIHSNVHEKVLVALRQWTDTSLALLMLFSEALVELCEFSFQKDSNVGLEFAKLTEGWCCANESKTVWKFSDYKESRSADFVILIAQEVA